MRKFTKFTLTLALLFGVLGGVKASTNVDMSTATASTNATWTSETNTFAWTAQNEYIVIPGLSGDLTGCFLELTISDGCHIDIVYTDDSRTEGGWNGYGRFGSGGSKTQDLGFMAGAKINSVKEVRICSQSTSGSITVTDVSYYFAITPTFNALGVATINLDNIDVTGDVSYNPTTHIVTKTTGSGAFQINFNSVDLRNVTGISLSATTSGTESEIVLSDILGSVTVHDNINNDLVTWSYSKWNYDFKAYKANAGHVTYIRFNVNNNGSMKINSITLTADKMNAVNAHDVPIAALPHFVINNAGNVSQTSSIFTNYGVLTDIFVGDGSGNNDEYIDIEDYDELRVYTANENVRVFFFNANSITAGTNNTTCNIVFVNTDLFSHNSVEGYYYATIPDIKDACNNQAKVIGVKASGTATVSKVQLYKESPQYDYILSGQYSSAVDVSTITSDATVTAIDCSGLSGNGVAISSANPNCLFVANAGVLANNKNVIVGSTCANLELTDGEPFKAPADFTATNAKFTKPVGEAGYATMVIPFAVATLPEGVEAYNLTGVTGESITYSTAATIAADKPVLIKATEGTYNFEASGVAVAATADGVVTNGLLNGGYATMTAAADANNYVLQNNANGVNFYLVTGTDATVKPFRAYLMASGAGARALNLDLGETTGISASLMNSDERIVKSEVYNLNGQRVAAPQKGLYIVNGKKVIVK